MKKQRRNGFTLIELLAVIIILAVIALIATPIALNVVENAQKKAFERSAQGYYDAARYVYNDMMLNEEEKDTMFIFENSVQRSDNEKYTLTVQGEVPKKGLVYLTKDGEVLVSIANDKWCATTNGSGTVELTDDPNACGYAPEECFTFSDFTLTDTMKTEMNNQDLGFEGMDDTLLQVDSFDKENPACKGMVIIPSEHEGRKVEGIKQEAFSSYDNNNLNITSVILPEEMKIINESAFDSAGNLKQVIMNEELRYIDSYAFVETNLTEITIPSRIAYLGRQAFADSRLKKVNLLAPNVKSVATANQFPFVNTLNEVRNAIEEVTIGPNVQSIPGYLFYKQSIKEITIPDNLTSIGSHAFAYNQITHLIIPNSVTTIEEYAFYENQLTNLVISNGVENINSFAFAKNQLTHIDLPDSLTNIGTYAFSYNQLKSLDIPDSVTNLGNRAFFDNQIADLTVGKTVNYRTNQNSLQSPFKNNPLTNVTIREGATQILGIDFADLQIQNLSIASTVTAIGNGAFTNNQLPDNQAFIYARNSDGSVDNTKLVSYGGAKKDNVIIPNGVITIGEFACSLADLTSVTIPSSVTTIEDSAFSDNKFPNASAITILGDATRFDSNWTNIGFPAK